MFEQILCKVYGHYMTSFPFRAKRRRKKELMENDGKRNQRSKKKYTHKIIQKRKSHTCTQQRIRKRHLEDNAIV